MENDDIKIVDLQVNSREKAIASCRYSSFAKSCYWLLMKYKESNIFYVRDLCKIMKISYPAGFEFFEKLNSLGYVRKVRNANTIHFELINNSETPKLKELLPYIKKTLEV